MATARTPRPQASSPDAIPQPPQTTPIAAPLQDHSFTLQMIMELQKSVGQLTASVDGMKATLDSVKTKVDSLQAWKQMIIGGAVVLAFVSSLITWGVTKASDYFVLRSTLPPTPVAPDVRQPPIVSSPKKTPP